jgi:vitamin B12 transporter
MKIIRSAFPLVVLLLFLVAALPAFPQSQSGDAQLSGNLTDLSGAALVGVRVTAQLQTSPDAPRRFATTAADGSYSLSLPPGEYRIQFALAPFAARDLAVDLTSGATRTLNIRMELAALSDQVLVTGNPEPIEGQQSSAPNSIISREEMDLRQSVGLPDLLSYSTGVIFSRTGANGGTASLFLDGGNSNFVKVLVDGSPINPPGGAVDFSILTADNLDKIEIVRGAESALYGTDAVSGVVQLFSHRGTTTIPAFSIFSEGGSSSSGRGGGELSGLLGRFDYSGAASYLQTEGQYPNTDFINRTLSGNFGYSFNPTNQLRLSLRNNDADAGVAGQTVFTPPSLHQRYNQELFSANARWDFATGTHWQHQVMGAESYTRQHSFNPEQSFYISGPDSFCPQTSPTAVATTQFCDFVFDSRYQYDRASINAQTTYSVQKFTATAGYQYEVENASIYFLEQPHVRRNNQAGFLDFRYTPLSRLSLDFGFRIEGNDYFGTRAVPRAGVNFLLRRGQGAFGDTRLRAFYGQGIKEPRLDQTYGTDPCDPGNLSLKPESSKNWSVGFDQKLVGDRVRLGADYFSNRFYDIVSFAFCLPDSPCPVTPPPGCTFGYGNYFNTDLARARGTNIDLEVRATRWLFIRGNYTYDDSLVIKAPNAFDPALLPGNQLLRRPANSGSVTFSATFKRFNATFAGYFVGERTDSDFLNLGLTRNPGYARFDISTSYTFYRGLAVYARATNLFDKSYQDALGYPALGRDARIGLRYQFSGRD